MRELRFRAWDGEQMVCPDYIDRGGVAHWKMNSIPNSSSDVMMFTGLLDKQGWELYEGDLVGRCGLPYVVSWHSNLVKWYLKGIYPGDTDVTKVGASFSCDLIGNIYEDSVLNL